MKWAFAMACLALGACGYRFTAGAPPLPEGIRTVHVTLLFNRTSEPGLEAIFTQALREQAIRSGVAGGQGSDAQLAGDILWISGQPNIPNRFGGTFSYRVTAKVQLRLWKAGKVASEAEVNGSEDYLPGADLLAAEANRGAAVRRLAETMMREGFERLGTGF